MDSRLWQVNGARLARLRRQDLPRVAQAIVDAEFGRATFRAETTRDVAYVTITRPEAYTVTILGSDWAKLLPFYRNASMSFDPPPPLPPTPPPPVMSPQPNRLMEQPPPKPPTGFVSYADKLPYNDLRRVNAYLSANPLPYNTPSVSSMGVMAPTPPALDPPEVPPPPEPASALDPQEQKFYYRVLGILEQLFPDDYPRSPL